MKRLKEIFKDKKLYIFLAISLLFFGLLVRINFSVDTYLLFASKDLGYVSEYVRSGRLITVAFFKLMQLLRFGINMMYFASYLLAIICTTLSMYFISDLFNKYIRSTTLNIIISALIIINPFIIELWLFVESGIMMLSILACVLAVRQINEYFEFKHKKNIIYCMLYMLLALFCYQGTVGIFVLLGTIFVIVNTKKIKDFILNNVYLFVCYLVPTLINFIVVKVIGNSRVNSSYNLMQTLDFIIRATKEQLMNAFGLLPDGVFRFAIYGSLSLIIILIIVNNYTRDQKSENIDNHVWRDLGYLFYILVVGYVFTVITVIPQNIETAVMFARTSYAFGSIIGIMYAYTIIHIYRLGNHPKIYKTFIVLSIIVLVIELVSIWKIEINRYKVNELDREIILKINEEIDKYEMQSGNKITKLAVYNLERANKFYEGLDDHINVSAKSEMPSCLALLVFYTRKQIKQVDEDKIVYEEHFKNKQWNGFNLNQIYIEKETLHWYIY